MIMYNLYDNTSLRVRTLIELFFCISCYTICIFLSAQSNTILTQWGRVLHNYHTQFNPHHHNNNSTTSTSFTSPIFDFGLYLFPHYDLIWLPDATLLILLLITAYCILFHDNKSTTTQSTSYLDLSYWVPRVHRLTLYLRVHGILLFYRTISSLITIQRPSPRCSAHNLFHLDNAGWLLNSGCFDLMFSGHSSSSILSTIFIFATIPKQRIFLRGLILMFGLFSCIANIIIGDHYSNDVFIAVVLSYYVSIQHIDHYQNTFKQDYVQKLLAKKKIANYDDNSYNQMKES